MKSLNIFRVCFIFSLIFQISSVNAADKRNLTVVRDLAFVYEGDAEYLGMNVGFAFHGQSLDRMIYLSGTYFFSEGSINHYKIDLNLGFYLLNNKNTGVYTKFGMGWRRFFRLMNTWEIDFFDSFVSVGIGLEQKIEIFGRRDKIFCQVEIARLLDNREKIAFVYFSVGYKI